jgi:hypothetical protein
MVADAQPAGEVAGDKVPEPQEVPFENEDLIGGPPSGVEVGGVVGGPVLDHVQRFADALCHGTDACTISTYNGHHPDRTRALDILVSSGYGAMPNDFSFGDGVADFTFGKWSDFEVLYIIWRQRINSNDGRGWRAMEDRGSITQNHFDHCHVSFQAGASGGSSSASAGGATGFPGVILRIGSSGEHVCRIQERLRGLGFSIDRFDHCPFGPQTEGAVMEFQRQRGLVDDGEVGPNTWAALFG